MLLATCGVDSIFTYVNIGGYGSESDGGVFRNSTLGVMLDSKEITLPDPQPVNGTTLPYYFVGDAAFPLRSYLMTPYSGRFLEPDKFLHNQELSKARCCIENAFGILSSRWRVFLNTMQVNPENADNIIMSAILLHNYIMMSNRQRYANHAFLMGEWRNVVENNIQQLQPLPPRMRMGARNAATEAINIRDDIKNVLSQPTT